MLEITVRYIDEDMRTPRGSDHQFTRTLDEEDFLDMAEDMLEATHSLPFTNSPSMSLHDSVGLLLIEATEGKLYWSRPDEPNTGKVESNARDLATALYVKETQT